MRTPDRLCVAWVLLCVVWPGVRAEHANGSAVFEGFTCALCGSHEYCQSGESTDCPDHSDNPVSGGSVHDCKCNGGYLQLNASGEAHTCSVGLPPHYYTLGQINNCPGHMGTNEPKASSKEFCKCMPGYVYKQPRVYKKSNCLSCDENTYMDKYDQYSGQTRAELHMRAEFRRREPNC